MTDPHYRTNDYRTSLGIVRDLLVVAVAIALTIWTLVDDTLPDWLLRLTVAGALTAGVALTLAALHRLTGRP